ncbi:unnamed protein product [Phytomonas sp. Hart1]|nr:unnamed protein product [Phytomonas sp. Hart1]|eukprot:CCW68543.1 unnamed protein product [Phytomonas sp. isolate Hart1]
MIQGPFFVIPTQKGSVPNMTPSQAQAILNPDERFISVSLFDAIDFSVPCKAAQMNFSRICGLHDFQTIMVNRSSFHGLHPSALSTASGISGECEKGRITVTVEKYKDLVKILQPNFAITMTESVPHYEPRPKKRKIAYSRTESWLDEIEVSCNELDCVLIKPFSVRGALGGFLDIICKNENGLELALCLKELQQNLKTTSFACSNSMVSVFTALLFNVSFIESPVPWTLAGKGVAIILAFGDVADATRDPEIDLNDEYFSLDINPLCPGCACYTCRRHTRAYIHHLLTVQEMNSTILLSIHNFHRLVEVFRRVRSLSLERRREFLVSLIKQY